MQDLIVLCADQDARLGLEALLKRAEHLGMKAITFKVVRHPNHDNGVFQTAQELLRSQHKLFSHALAICDFEGCGREHTRRRAEIEEEIEKRLEANGWEGRAAAVVVEPEIEAWVWGDWQALAKKIEWPDGETALRNWLVERKLIEPGVSKPRRPKEALERVLRQRNLPASSELFAALGRTGDIAPCTDPAFSKLLNSLRVWFPL